MSFLLTIPGALSGYDRGAKQIVPFIRDLARSLAGADLGTAWGSQPPEFGDFGFGPMWTNRHRWDDDPDRFGGILDAVLRDTIQLRIWVSFAIEGRIFGPYGPIGPQTAPLASPGFNPGFNSLPARLLNEWELLTLPQQKKRRWETCFVRGEKIGRVLRRL